MQTNDARSRNQKDAATAYADHREDIASLLDLLEQELTRRHADAEAGAPSWASVGDLGHIRERLLETAAFAFGTEPEDLARSLAETRD